MGHLVRCMSLARALADDGTKAFFLLRGHASPRLDRSDREPMGTRRSAAARPCRIAAPMPGTTGYARTLAVNDGLAARCRAGQRWRRSGRSRGGGLACCRSLRARCRLGAHAAPAGACVFLRSATSPIAPHDCDILLDQNLVLEMETRYLPHLPATCRSLLGPRYALLRPEFAAQRRSLTGRSGQIRRILICYGGSDPGNETARALSAIKSLSSHALAIDVAIGLSNPHVDSISSLCREMPCAELHRGADNMAELMRRADLARSAQAVSCAGSAAASGCPTIAVGIATNQIGALTALARAAAIVLFGLGRGRYRGRVGRSR